MRLQGYIKRHFSFAASFMLLGGVVMLTTPATTQASVVAGTCQDTARRVIKEAKPQKEATLTRVISIDSILRASQDTANHGAANSDGAKPVKDWGRALPRTRPTPLVRRDTTH